MHGLHAFGLATILILSSTIDAGPVIPLAIGLLRFLLAANTPPLANATLGPKERTLIGYDCTQPQQKTPLASPASQECEKDDGTVNQENATYAVLQRAAWVRTKAVRCVEKRTVIAFYCGVYSHQTFIPDMSSFHVNRKVEADACRKAFRDEQYDVGNGKKYRLRRNARTVFSYSSAGWTYYTASDVTCEGAPYF